MVRCEVCSPRYSYHREVGLIVDHLTTLYQVNSVYDVDRHGDEHEFWIGIWTVAATSYLKAIFFPSFAQLGVNEI